MISRTVLYARTHVLVRESPDVKARVSFSLARGDSAEVDPVIRAETEGTGWVRIHYRDGRMGWCERHLLSEATPGKG